MDFVAPDSISRSASINRRRFDEHQDDVLDLPRTLWHVYKSLSEELLAIEGSTVA